MFTIKSNNQKVNQGNMVENNMPCEQIVPDVNAIVKQKFIDLFNTKPMIVNSPGRINLIGEHTDYNNGFVMPAAINKGIQFAIAPSKEKKSMVYANRYNQFFSIDLTDLKPVEEPYWVNYLLGILYQFQAKGLTVKPFNCVFDGDLPLGAGLSSSAALECGFAFALNELNAFHLSKLELIHIAQWAEHNYVGVKCGIMDQFTSMMGQENQVMVLDCQSLDFTYFPLVLNEYCLLLCDTNVKHKLASSEYNTRRLECEQGVAILQSIYPSIKSLRDASVEMILEHSELFPENVFNRCIYVTQENERVLSASQDLRTGQLAAFGEKMFETHEGLSHLYEVSCAELDFLVEQAKEFKDILGARMMGGGFGGCTINIIHQDMVGEFRHQTKKAYKERFKIELNSYVVNTGNGTSVIES
jgi:galactokinase